MREDRTLAWFIRMCRRQFKEGTLGKEWIAKLEAIGFVWDPQAQVLEARLDELRKFKKKHGHCDVASTGPRNRKLATCLYGLRRRHQKGELSAERQQLLKEIGVEWL